MYVISNNLQFCKRLGLETGEEHKSLPFMYWMLKLQYTPSPARFKAYSQSTTKLISKVISKLFKNILSQISSFHYEITCYRSYNRIWLVFAGIVKTLSIVMYITLDLLLFINFRNYYQKIPIIVKTIRLTIKIQVVFKKCSSIIHTISISFL